MELEKITAVDFGLFASLELRLNNLGLVCIVGDNRDSDAATSNGTGKSTIIKALAWGLYGESIDGADGDAVIKSGCTSATVTITGKSEGVSVIIVRQRFKASPKLALIVGDNPWSTSKTEIQKRINELMGMDFNTFRNTVMYGQGDRKRFVDPSATDAERKALLSSILRIGDMPECATIARTRAAELKSTITSREIVIKKVEDEIDNLDVDAAQELYDSWEAARRKRAITARDNAKVALGRAQEASEKADELRAKYQDELARARSRFEHTDGCQEAHEAAKKIRDEARERHRELIRQRGATAEQIEEISSKLLTGDKCPVCTTDIKSGVAAVHFGAMDKQKCNLIDRYHSLKPLIDQADSEARAANATVLSTADDVGTWLQAKSDMAAISDRISNVDKSVESLVSAHRETAIKWKDACKEILAEANPHEGAAERIAARIERLAESIALTKSDIEGDTRQIANLQFWAKGFGTQGLPSFMLDGVMPYLTERANHYLEVLSDGDITMCFSTQRELKSAKGAMRDEIAITWEVEGVSSYPPSGGQLKKMEIATDLALMDLVATREGGHPDILFMDEILDGLDDEGKNRVTKLLHELRKARGSIFVISHDDGFSESFDQTIKVTKLAGTSTAQVVR